MSKDSLDHLNRSLRTLQHCALYRRTINVTCPACKHETKFDAVVLWWLFQRKRWDDRLPGAMRRFVCSKCRRAGRRTIGRHRITRDDPDQTALPYPDKTTWRQLVSRYRS